MRRSELREVYALMSGTGPRLMTHRDDLLMTVWVSC